MFCKSCGESLKAGVKFCGKCGATVEVTASEGIQCPKCGAINWPGAKFCRQDGTPLVDAPAMSQRPSAGPPAAERVASQAAPTVSPVTREPPPAELAPPLRPAHAETVQVPAGGGASRLWLAIGALVVLTSAGGGYWLYKSRGASPQVVETAQVPDSQTPETYAPREQEGDVVEPPAPAKSETPSSAQSQVADAPQVSVGDRWVTEVVDHQDPALSYRAERTVTDVGPDRIFTSVRTLGKDYTRVVEYTGEWALVATHLRSGATTSYLPALPYLSFPLQPGRSWQERVVETDAEGKQRVHDVRARMESWETVQVPAGIFESVKIVLTDDISKDGVVVQQGQDVSWYAPEARRTVKTEETSFDPATGERRRRTISLVEYSVGGGDGAVSGTMRAGDASLAGAAPLLADRGAIAEWISNCKDPPLLCTAADVQTMLKQGADPNVPAQNGAPPIVAVVQLGLGVDVLDALIKGGARIDERSTLFGNTALIETSLFDDEVAVPYIRALMAAGADVDARDAQQGWTALMHHAYQGPRPAAVRALVEAGADVRLKGKDGATALLLAERRLGEFNSNESDPGQWSGALESRKRLLAECQEVIDILKAAER